MKVNCKLFITVLPICMILILCISSVPYAQSQSQIYTLSTRNHFDDAGNIVNDDAYNPFDFQSVGCPQEVAVYVHGVWTVSGTNQNSENEGQNMMLDNAAEIFDRARLSLDRLGYNFPLIGFTWDSDTEISQDGWAYAKIIASDNCPKLAQFLVDLENYCNEQEPNTNLNIRLIGHSLGARVILSALENLSRENELSYKIESVNLMGAAVDDDEVSNNPNDIFDAHVDDDIKFPYGEAIERTVSHFYNLVNAEDDVLEHGGFNTWFGVPFYFQYNFFENQPVYYPFYEQDLALGQNGKQSYILEEDLPENYQDIFDIEQQVPNLQNANMDNRCDLINPVNSLCTIRYFGDNHLGYAGFIDEFGNYRDNGAMDVVVTSWFDTN
jgi:pimeloyl-ACP methyl ester carboxylesterase